MSNTWMFNSAAEKIQDLTQVRIVLMVTEGKDPSMEKAHKKGLKNVVFIPQSPKPG